MQLQIKDLRIKKGLTQAELAESTGIERTSIVRIENGSQGLNVHRAHKLAQALGCTVDDLFREAASDAAAGDDEAGKGSDEKRTHDRDDGAGTFRDA